MGSGVTCLVSFLFLMTGLHAQTTVPEDNVVWTDPSRTIWLGERNVNITCNFRGTPYAVYWMKGAAPTSASEVVTWYGDSVTYGGDIDSAAFKINGDYSLRLVSPTEADTGRYICRVSNYNGFLIYNHTDVEVLDPANFVAHTTPNVTAWKGSDVFLPCDFRGIAERVIWNKVSGTGEYQLLETMLTYDDDSYSVGGDRRFSWGSDFSLHLQKIEVPDESNYTCQVWKTDGIELNNHTMLTVNARPDEPYVLIDQCGSHTIERQCTRNITDDTQTFKLVCTVNGAKPRIDGLSWSETVTGRTINDTLLSHEEQEDGTHNSRLVMDIHLSNVSSGTAFTCTATGSAVYDTWNQTVVIAIVPAEVELPPPSGLSSGGKAAVAVFIILLLIVCFVGVFIFLYVRHKPTLERVFPKRFLRLFVCLDRFTESSRDNEELAPLDPLIAKLEQRREKIRTYVPGKVSSFSFSENTTFNIGLYGVMTSGKSALTNSLNFAFTGEYKSIAAESSVQTEGGSTMYKNTVPLTSHVHLIDTRGMKDYDEKGIKYLKEDILGKLGQDSKTKTKIGKQTHCPVFVLKSSDKPTLREGVTFLKSFSDIVHKNYGRYPHVVVTHKHDLVLGGERAKVHDITVVNETGKKPNETEKSDNPQEEMEQGNLTKNQDFKNEEIPGVQEDFNEKETRGEHQLAEGKENTESVNKSKNKKNKKNKKVKEKQKDMVELDPNTVDTDKKENNTEVNPGLETDQAKGRNEEAKQGINIIESNTVTSGADTKGVTQIANKPVIKENKMEQQNKGVNQDEDQPTPMEDKGHVDNVTKTEKSGPKKDKGHEDNVTKTKKSGSNFFNWKKSQTKENVEEKRDELGIDPVDTDKEGEKKTIIHGSETGLAESHQEQVRQTDKCETIESNSGTKEDMNDEEQSTNIQITNDYKVEQQKEENYKKTQQGAEKSKKGRGLMHLFSTKKEKDTKTETTDEENQEVNDNDDSVKDQTENSMVKLAKQVDKPTHEEAGPSGHIDTGHPSEGEQALTSVNQTSNKERDINQKDEQEDLLTGIIHNHTKIPKHKIHAFENYTEENHEENRERSIAFLDFVWSCLDTAERNAQFREEQEKEKKSRKKNPFRRLLKG